MKGDFSRTLTAFDRQYNNLLMQQGRVQTDADFNEQTLRTELRISDQIRDFIGHAGAPATNVQANTSTAFQVTVDSSDATKLNLGPGRYYVDGQLYVNLASTSVITPTAPIANQWYLAYLNVWQRFFSALDDLSILEPALTGADTAGRVENVWEVHVHAADNNPPIYTDPGWIPDPGWSDPAISQATLAVQPKSSGSIFENRLYRIEIHQGGVQSAATFKWSRDNGSIAARVADITGARITLGETLGNPAVDFAAGIWIELKTVGAPDEVPGLLARLQSVQNNVLTVVGDGTNIQPFAPSVGTPGVIVRRWDSGDASAGDIHVNTVANAWITLGDDELEVQFDTTPDNLFRTGDYWWFTTRTAIGLNWPSSESPQFFQPASGITHSFSALALVQWNGTAWTGLQDLRPLFVPPGKGFVPTTGATTMDGPLTIRNGLTINGTDGSGLVVAAGGLTVSQGDLNIVKGAVNVPAGSLTVSGAVLSGNSRQLAQFSSVTNLPSTTTSVWQDVPGLVITGFQTPANAPVCVIFRGAGFNIISDQVEASGGLPCCFQLLIDGTAETSSSYFFSSGGNTGSIDVGLQWYGVLAAGAHTFKVQFNFVSNVSADHAVLSQSVAVGATNLSPNSSLVALAL
jgi:Family of unknown function (DUF6519)